jgi:protein-tyrosine phosphatase
MESKTSILFVCLGNICRSPVAEAVFLEILNQHNLSHQFKIDSAATSPNHIGEKADPRTRKQAISKGIDITHRARQLHPNDFLEFDYILAMDKKNLEDIEKIAPENNKAILAMFASFDPDPNFVEVPDPYWGDAKDFEQVYELCQKAGHHLLKHLLKS